MPARQALEWAELWQHGCWPAKSMQLLAGLAALAKIPLSAYALTLEEKALREAAVRQQEGAAAAKKTRGAGARAAGLDLSAAVEEKAKC